MYCCIKYLICLVMIVVAVHMGSSCDSLYLLRVRFHTFSAENCTTKDDLGALYLIFIVKDEVIVAYYLL